jgi:hypothetical protein
VTGREPGRGSPRRTGMRRIATTPATALVALSTAAVLATAGCARPVGAPGDAFPQRARDVAGAWQAALDGGAGEAWRTGLVPLQDLTLPPDRGLTDDTRFAFASGWYHLAAELPAGTPAPGTVTFADRSTLPVPLVGAADAYAAIHQGDPPPCSGPAATGPAASAGASGPGGSVGAPARHTCVSLTVTAASLGTATLRTSRGPATVPAWLFTIAGLPAPVARVAIAGTALSPVPHSAASPLTGDQARALVPVQKLTAVDGTRLGYTIGIGACDHNPAGVAYETADLVVVSGTVTRSTGDPCPDLLKLQPVAATLAKPLGARVVLDAVSGQPLILTATGR